MDGTAEELIPVRRWPSLREADEHALVVLAMNQDCRVRAEEDGAFALEVEPAARPVVEKELELYASEQLPVVAVGEPASTALQPSRIALWVAALVVMFALQQRDPWMEDDLMNSTEGFFGRHEWWRPFTALFLHADLGHLMGNVVIGGFFCMMVASLIGSWRGWMLILLSGVAGNVLTTWFHSPDAYFSLGASTATFGALGILVGAGLREAWESHRLSSLKSLIGPFGGGIALLVWFGTSGADTDIIAHFMGWGSGCLLGLTVIQSSIQDEKVAA
jgi:membrane associated rhomboid family serine protease